MMKLCITPRVSEIPAQKMPKISPTIQPYYLLTYLLSGGKDARATTRLLGLTGVI